MQGCWISYCRRCAHEHCKGIFHSCIALDVHSVHASYNGCKACCGACHHPSLVSVLYFIYLQNLSDIRGLSDAKIQKIVEAARKLCPSAFGFITAKECEVQREHMIGMSSRTVMLTESRYI